MTEEIKQKIKGFLNQAQPTYSGMDELAKLVYSLASEQLTAAEARLSELQAELLCEMSAVELKNNRIKELEEGMRRFIKSVDTFQPTINTGDPKQITLYTERHLAKQLLNK